jgi:hypothetical protein
LNIKALPDWFWRVICFNNCAEASGPSRVSPSLPGRVKARYK